jgi:hypothetical protein
MYYQQVGQVQHLTGASSGLKSSICVDNNEDLFKAKFKFKSHSGVTQPATATRGNACRDRKSPVTT